MFLKTTMGNNVLIFRDTFNVNLKPELYGKYEEVSAIIDEIFNLEQVIIAKPSTASHGCPPVRSWVTVHLETKPIDNEEDANKFAAVIMEIDGVEHAHLILNLPAKNEEIIEHLYGGTRSKV